MLSYYFLFQMVKFKADIGTKVINSTIVQLIVTPDNYSIRRTWISILR